MIKVLLNVFKTTFVDPLAEFIHDSRAIGIVLICFTAISLVLANLSASYTAFWNTEIPFFHSLHLPHSILHFINDGLMAVFFFLAGMEIRRELTEGELSSFKKSILPVAGAIGGMAVPAFIFFMLNIGNAYTRGWAIPTATDIAFSLGVASLVGKRVPVSIKVFLTALAIIDDLGAIIVIALFYGGKIELTYLLSAVVVCLLLWAIGKKVKRITFITVILGLILWYCMFNSGIHATIAGVAFAFLIPADRLNHLQLKLHHPVYFIIMPLFALANTAIVFPSNPYSALGTSLAWGIMIGLFVGKPVGIFLASYILIRLKLSDLPNASTFKQLVGAGILAGIGFTMSIFIATLAFSAENQDISKIAVLIASLASGISGYFWLKSTAEK
jgi:Na+:H+ antiporter, NhaA family